MRTANLASVLEVLEALEGTGTGAWGWDVATNTIRWSRNTGSLYGRAPGFEPDSYEHFLSLVHPDDRASVVAAVEACLGRAEDYDIDFRAPWPNGEVRWLNARGHAITDEARVTARIVGVVSDITERRRTAEQHRFLAEASELLAGSLDVEHTLTRVAELLVASLADWCSVQMVDQGRLRTAVVAHREPAMVTLVERLLREFPPDPEPTGVARTVLESGAPVLIEEISDEMLEESATDDRHLEMLRSLGLHSALTVPVIARGRTLALVTLVSAESLHRYSEADVLFAEELARHAALALDNARLHHESQSARAQAERSSAQLLAIHNVVSRLSQAVDMTSVAQAAIEEGIPALGADRGAVVLRGESGPQIVASSGYPSDRLDAFRDTVGQPGPLHDAMNEGVAVFCRTPAELVGRYPNLREIMASVTDGAFIAAPLRTVDGVLGAIGFVYATSQQFTSAERALATALAQHVALAVDRSMLFDRIRFVAEGLQAALAPPHVVEQGALPVAARYRAAGVGAIGGDWYDVIDQPHDGSYVYVIGDVVGRGLEAVATMAQLRHSLRMLLLEGHSPAQALAMLSAVSRRDETALCSTVLCAKVAAGSQTIELASAGHLPPAMVGVNRAELLELPVGPPLGVGDGPPTHMVTVGPDECLVLYTDGVIERRGRDIDSSLRVLTTVLSHTEPDVEAIADALLDQATDADDDATILVIGGSPDCRRH